MRIDPKYFTKFIIGLGIFFTLLIAWFSISQIGKQHTSFELAVGDGSTLYNMNFRIPNNPSDSLSASYYAGSYVLMDFWSPWANRSHRAHEDIYDRIMRSDTRIIVFSPAVKDTDENIIAYAETVDYPFIFVVGTEAYQDEIIPGVPAYLLFSPDGELLEFHLGYRGTNDLDFLNTYLD